MSLPDLIRRHVLFAGLSFLFRHSFGALCRFFCWRELVHLSLAYMSVSVRPSVHSSTGPSIHPSVGRRPLSLWLSVSARGVWHAPGFASVQTWFARVLIFIYVYLLLGCDARFCILVVFHAFRVEGSKGSCHSALLRLSPLRAWPWAMRPRVTGRMCSKVVSLKAHIETCAEGGWRCEWSFGSEHGSESVRMPPLHLG